MFQIWNFISVFENTDIIVKKFCESISLPFLDARVETMLKGLHLSVFKTVEVHVNNDELKNIYCFYILRSVLVFL